MPGKIVTDSRINTARLKPGIVDVATIDEAVLDSFPPFPPALGDSDLPFHHQLEYVIATFPYNPTAQELQDHFSPNDEWSPTARGRGWVYGTIQAPREGSGGLPGVDAWAVDPDTVAQEDTTSWLTSPIFDFSALSGSGFLLRFYLWLDSEVTDGLKLQASVDEGPWIDINGSFAYNGTIPNFAERFGGSDDGWSGSFFNSSTLITSAIAPFEGESHVRFRFAFLSQLGSQSTIGPVIDAFSIS